MTIREPAPTRATTLTRPPKSHDRVGNRLRRAAGQLGGVLTMYEDGRHPTDILDQIAATRAALDAVALLLLDEHTAACVRRVAASDDTDRVMTDLIATVRRYLRSR